jgi:phosphomannomutase/phosphoglucomutase
LSKIKIDKKLKIIIDIGNGTCGEVAGKIFEKLNCEVKFLFPEPDENFPNHIPDPLQEESLKVLRKEVIKNEADIGIAYDGDGDRVGVVDEMGNIIRSDILFILIAKKALEKEKNLRFLFEVRCSRLTSELIKKSGGIPEFVRVGHSYIMQEARKKKAIAGELSGHFYFPEYYYDDGFFASLKIIEILSNSDKKLSEMIDFGEYYSSPEIRISYPDNKKFKFVKRVKENFIKRDYDIITVDGARVEFEDGWGLVRASNTEPKLVLRFEGKDKKTLEEIKNKIMEVVKEEAEKDGIEI